MKEKKYFVEFTFDFEAFLRFKGIKYVTSDADIIMFTLECYNDTAFFDLMIEYSVWYAK